jgi:hypothetical protein
MLDYHLASMSYREHEREVKQYMLEQQVLKAWREKGCLGTVARAWSWLSHRAAALLPGKQPLPAPERGGC